MTDTVPVPADTAPEPSPPAPVLELRDVDVLYGRVRALHGVSLYVNGGEVVALIGSNGAGKTTTLRAISGLVRPASGAVLLDGQPIHTLGAEIIARRGVAHAPEGRRLFSRMTVRENLEMGAFSRRDGTELRADYERVYDLFPVVEEFRERSAGALSGGQQQQLAIARALVAEPDVLLLDEPSLGLAPAVVDVVFDALAAIRDRGLAVLLVEQRAQRTVAIADRSHVLANGELRLTLGPESAEDTDTLVAAYFS